MKKFEKPEMEIIIFETKDIIVTSGSGAGQEIGGDGNNNDDF